MYAAKKFLDMSSNSNGDVHSSMGGLPPGWSPDREEGGGLNKQNQKNTALLEEVQHVDESPTIERMKVMEGGDYSRSREKEEATPAAKTVEAVEATVEAAEAATITATKEKEEEIRLLHPVEVDRLRFNLYQPLLQKIIEHAGQYDESEDTSYERGLYLMLHIIRSIFWPDAQHDWTQHQNLHKSYNMSHGIELKRRVLYYLSGALWNQFQKEMLQKSPLNRRKVDWYGEIDPRKAKYETTSMRATPSLRYVHEIMKVIDRCCLPSLLEEKLLRTIHLMMSHESRVTHTLHLRQHKRRVCTEMGISEKTYLPHQTWPHSPLSFFNHDGDKKRNGDSDEGENDDEDEDISNVINNQGVGWCRDLPCDSHYRQSPEEYDLYQYPCGGGRRGSNMKQKSKKKEGGGWLNRTLSCLYVQMASNVGQDAVLKDAEEHSRSNVFLQRNGDDMYLSDVATFTAKGLEDLRARTKASTPL